ncbi:SapC family protein [Orrella daihaiensis]|uniref:SapC family protein n=1 Tax=Orrella daihaiensis TaxID=2782176 RepID=A0ABY4AJD6_9BURK|nr:SapC family protein [Orrella daihaiensis]UOD50400.1 SapC family protein [Orrella daihaiensis]
MAIVPISQSEFGNKRFKRYESYAFAAKDALAPLVLKELVRATMVMPVGFAMVQDAFVPVAVLGLGNGKNLFVAPDGRWVGRYVPAAYRGYPYVLANGPEDKQILCFDDSSGLLSETEGEPFFGEDGKPTQAINDILNFLTQLAVNRQATQRVCALLQEHGLIEPWPIKLKGKEGEPERNLEGLFRINEVAFNQLDEKSLHVLHQGGALPVIYCQLLSMQHLPVLGELAKAYEAAEQQAALPKNEAGEIDLSFLADDTTISFENL